MDAVYRIRAGGQHEELRFSLRSLAVCLPVDRVWIVGYLPEWLKDVIHLPHKRRGSKYETITDALVQVCHESELSERFLLIDDDVFPCTTVGRSRTR